MSLSGKVVVVTGASRGIGRAIALRLLAEGAHVVANYRANEEAAAALRADAGDHATRLRLARADVSRSADASALIADVLRTEGVIDALVNNAAITHASLAHRTTDETWASVMDTNVGAAFFLCRAALPAMYERGSGHVVNIASASSFAAIPPRGAAAYVASKHALIGLTKALAHEAAPKNVLVNAVAPGVTDTDMIRGLDPPQREALLATVPLRRIATAEEIAAMAVWVLTEVRYSTGNVFHCSGGTVMG